MRSRRIFDVLGLSALATVTALAVIGPAGPALADKPRDTFTHVAMRIDDKGFTVTPSSVPAGVVEFTFVDARTDTSKAARIHSVPPPIDITAGGPPLTLTLRTLHNYALALTIADQSRPGGGFLSIDVPQIKAVPPARAHIVNLNVRATGIQVLARETRLDQPVKPYGANVPPGNRRWTTLAAGTSQFLVGNLTKSPLACSFDNASATALTIPAHHKQVFAASLPKDDYGPGFYVLTCAGGGITQQYDFWMV